MSYNTSDTGQITRGFHIQLHNMASEVFNEWTDDVDSELKKWHKDLRTALSVEIPAGERHRRRKNRGRLFPYYNGGDSDVIDLRDSFRIMPTESHTTKTAFRYTAGIEVVSDLKKLVLTNEGIPDPSPYRPGGWKGWADDVFGNRNRGDVKGLKHVFDKLTRKKRGL